MQRILETAVAHEKKNNYKIRGLEFQYSNSEYKIMNSLSFNSQSYKYR